MRNISLVAGFVLTAGCADLSELVPVRVVETQAAVMPDTDQPDADPRALTAFVTQLDGHGTWSDDDEYGTVWTPADEDFVPYVSDGRWAELGDGVGDGDAVWLADTSWGAVTCHHGRWVAKPNVDGARRWHWVPGLRYAGSWARWTHEGDRLSLAPVPPDVIWRHRVATRIAPPPPHVVDARTRTELVDAIARPNPLPVASDEMRRVPVERHVARLSPDASPPLDRERAALFAREPSSAESRLVTESRFGGESHFAMTAHTSFQAFGGSQANREAFSASGGSHASAGGGSGSSHGAGGHAGGSSDGGGPAHAGGHR